MRNNIELPTRKVYKTPRLLVADAYTVGSDLFQCDKAKEKSVYYIAFRRQLHKIEPSLYDEDDDRMIFVGLQDIIEELFFEPITHDEIDETKKFLSTFKASMKGLTSYHFNEEMWREIVDDYNGRPPIVIEALPEGSVVYPNEPVVQITCGVPDRDWGELSAYFESKLLQIWAPSERATANRHWFKYLTNMIQEVEPNLPLTASAGEPSVHFFASILCHDFGDRAGICGRESEILGKTHLYTFGGTDTVAGGYQAWKNADEQPGIATSVYALAHRNVQAWDNEEDCYKNLYDKADRGDFLSNVADCYDFFNAVENMLLPLAKQSAENNEEKIIIARPDSGDALEQVLFVIETAIKNDLYTERDGYTYPTTLKVIEGDGMSWEQMKLIFEVIKDKGHAPHAWCLFGIGGGLRNSIKRDNFSAKYALASVGTEDRGVIKISETEGKHTLPGPFQLRRDNESMGSKKTIAFKGENGDNALIEFFNGARIEKPFGVGQDDNFIDIKNRIQNEFDDMPKNLRRDETAFPATDQVLDKRDFLICKHAPQKTKNKLRL